MSIVSSAVNQGAVKIRKKPRPSKTSTIVGPTLAPRIETGS